MTDARLDVIAQNLASLNEIVSELIIGLAQRSRPDSAYAELVQATLRDLSWQLSLEFCGTRPSADDIERLGIADA